MNEDMLQHNQQLNETLTNLLNHLAGQQPLYNDGNTTQPSEYYHEDQYAQSAQQSANTQFNNDAQLSPLSSPVSSKSASPSISPRQSQAKK